MTSSGVVLPALFNTVVGRKEGRRREPDSNLTNGVVLEVHLLPFHFWVTAVPTAGVAGVLCSTYPLLQRGSRYVKQRVPATLAAGTAVTQW